MTVQAFTIRNSGGDYNTQSNNAYQFSDAVINVELAANTPLTITIPTISTAIQASGASTKKLLAFFSYSKTANVFLQPDVLSTIVFPTLGVPTLTNIELNTDLSGGREVTIGQQLQLLTADTGVYVTVRLYAVSNQI